MLNLDDEVMESGLCIGVIAALVWGIGLSVHALQEGSGHLSWLAWAAQLFGGILACVVFPPAFLLAREWVLRRLHPHVEPLQRQG